MKSPKIHRVVVYTDKEGIPGWWTYGFMSPTPQSARDVPPKTKCGQKNSVFYCSRAIKNVTSYEIFVKYSCVRVLLIDGGAAKKTLGYSTRKNKSNDLEPHFPT